MKRFTLSAAATTFALAAALGLAACSNDHIGIPQFNPSPTPTPPVVYTAIGASDAVGVGASVPCTATSNPVTCPGGTGYAPDLIRILRAAGAKASLTDLGISGAVIGPDILAEGNKYGTFGSPDACMSRSDGDVIPGDFLANEVPSLAAGQNFVTVFAGGNDTNALVNALICGAGGSTTASQTAYITTWITNFGHDFQTLILSIKSKNPASTVVVANLPNFAGIPFALGAPTPVRQALQAISVGMDVNVINMAVPLGIPVVDLLCDPRSYQLANFSSDGFHPNDAGYLIFAQQYLKGLQGTLAPPQASCSQMSIVSKFRLPVSEPFRLPSR